MKLWPTGWPATRGSGGRSVTSLLTQVRYEVLPTKAVAATVASVVPKDVTVTVTASPRKSIEVTVESALELAAAGYKVVPHVSARLLRDSSHLGEVVGRLREAGIEDVFVPAGDADPPVGVYDAALPVIVELAELEQRFRVGITGYPQTHPQITDDVTIQSMWDKRLYADYIVSNLCFSAPVLRDWIRRVRARGVTLPIYLGMAGPIEPTRLVEVARKIGVAESSRFAGGHLSWVARLSTPGGYQPERLLKRLAATLADPAAGIAGLHVFTFNQLEQTERWRQQLLAAAA